MGFKFEKEKKKVKDNKKKIADLEKSIEVMEAKNWEAYKSVQDMTVDAITTEKAIKAINKRTKEINKTKGLIKRLSNEE